MLSRWTSSTDVPMGVLAECECAPARTAGVPVDGARRGEGGGLGLPARDGLEGRTSAAGVFFL